MPSPLFVTGLDAFGREEDAVRFRVCWSQLILESCEGPTGSTQGLRAPLSPKSKGNLKGIETFHTCALYDGSFVNRLSMTVIFPDKVIDVLIFRFSYRGMLHTLTNSIRAHAESI